MFIYLRLSGNIRTICEEIPDMKEDICDRLDKLRNLVFRGTITRDCNKEFIMSCKKSNKN